MPQTSGWGSRGALLLLLALPVVPGFYLPGVAPHEYSTGQDVTVKVNSIKSVKTAIPYDYYSLMFCRPQAKGKIKSYAENLGEVLWGDVIKPSRYQFFVKKDVKCQKLCHTTVQDPKVTESAKGTKKAPTQQPIRKLKSRIDNEYRGHLILDNLPVSEKFIWENVKQAGAFYFRRGYPLGIPGNRTFPSIVNNHLEFTVQIHRPETLAGERSNDFRIVGFTVVPYSVDSEYIDTNCQTEGHALTEEWDISKARPQYITSKILTLPSGIPIAPTNRISWSFSVKWEEDPNVAWSSRWDQYLHSTDADNPRIHWFSIVNSLLVALFLAGVVAMIMLRTLHKDFNRYNNPENDDEALEETGWKLVHGDVFREPARSSLLAVYIGSGCQLFAMAVVTIIFACLGFLSPANRGALMKWMLICYVLMGTLAGYVTATFAKMFHEQSWKTVFMTGVWVPGKAFLVFLVLDILLWTQTASNAVPFYTLLVLIALWFGVTVPGTLLGGVLGYRQNTVEHPLDVNQIARLIPTQRWYLQGLVVIPLAGLVPFGTVFIELSFVLSSLWLNKFYYVFGFFAVVFAILVLTCAETSIVTTYFQLCYEDYRWWWRSFLASAAAGLYLFVYSVMYFTSTLELVNIVSVILYFSYMAIISYLFAVTTGTIGFLATFFFIRRIYAELHVD